MNPSKPIRNLVALLTLFTLGGIVLAQEKTAEPGKNGTLKAGERTVITDLDPTDVKLENLFPRNCKDWNVGELPSYPGSLFVCKGGKWTEYVPKSMARPQCQTPSANPAPDEGDRIYCVGGSVSAPIPIYKPDPEYSEMARKAKYEATAILWITINSSGTVTKFKVVTPLGLGLDEKAVEAVRLWKFKPAMIDDSPVTVRAIVVVPFRLSATQHPEPFLSY